MARTAATAYANRNADYADAIRSLALEELDGQDVDARAVHLANYMRVPLADVRFQVAEMVDTLAN